MTDNRSTDIARNAAVDDDVIQRLVASGARKGHNELHGIAGSASALNISPTIRRPRPARNLHRG
jgi:hypothetical protein